MAGKIKFLLEEEVQRERTTGGQWEGSGGGGLGTFVSVKVQQQSATKLDPLAFGLFCLHPEC